MLWLVAASLLWAFSFGLIKRFLPECDPWQVAAVRLTLAAAAFLPWTVRHAPAPRRRGLALLVGAVQFGAMYTLYLASFRYLAAWQVALWTVFTPILVVLLDGLRERRTRWHWWLAAGLAVVGAMLAQGPPRGDTLTGVLLVQGSNLCFAVGQLAYRYLLAGAGDQQSRASGREVGLLGWMYLGGAALAAVGALIHGGAAPPGGWTTVAPVLLYLGLVPTAVGFWCWNKGAARASAGRLAVANNLKIPLAVLVAWLVFAESAPYLRASLGLLVVVAGLALATADRWRKHRNPGR